MLGNYAREFFAQSPALFFPILALGIFVAVFALILFKVLRTDAASYGSLERLPLESDGLGEEEEGDDKSGAVNEMSPNPEQMEVGHG